MSLRPASWFLPNRARLTFRHSLVLL
jgi:hypothetical protein